MIAVGAPLALILLLFIAWSVSRRTAPAVPDVAVSTPAPTVVAASPPSPVAPAGALSAAPPTNIMLFGVSGGGPAGRAAILGGANGGQRVVAVGRDYLGMTVKEVGLDYAVLSGPGGDVRLELDRFGVSPVAAASLPSAASAAQASSVDQQREGLAYRTGLQQVASGGRTKGFAIKPGANLPHLARAGLRPGDIITGVNGARFDEERMLELPWQIANSSRVELQFTRGGKQMKSALSPPPKAR
jgi:type II secretory pathway component PulC